MNLSRRLTPTELDVLARFDVLPSDLTPPEENTTMKNAIDHTERGFGLYADFRDRYAERFTVQESSLATEPCVWIGKHDHRGHLTIEMAAHVRDALTGWLIDVGAEADPEGDPR